ncbi:hypothetical protein [Streptomyces sp. NPDC091371]|uniref:hypothetical protein n=1 Tax=Streptomyces sp. NPDC091371 TaxID=3155303 RepID=UPI00342CA4F2
MNDVGGRSGWQPQPWPLDEREWQKPPMSGSTKRGIGCGIGVLAMVLAPVALVGMVLAGRATAPGPPEGEPLVLAKELVAGSWSDAAGGTLELGADGRFWAAAVCGDFSDPTASGPGGSFSSRDLTWTGAGSWSVYDSSAGRKGVTEVTVRLDPGKTRGQYEARGSAEAPVLWAYVGDPDDGRVCVLKKRH